MAEKKKSNQVDELKVLFDKFDNTISTCFISERALAVLSGTPNWNKDLAYKVNYMKDMGRHVELMLNTKLSPLLPKKYHISQEVCFFAHPYMSKVCFQMNVVQTGSANSLPVKICIPLDKLVQMSPLEIFAIMTTATYAAVQKAQDSGLSEMSHVDLDNEKNSDHEAAAEKVAEANQNETNRDKAQKLLATYLEGFLARYYGKHFKEFDDISQVIAFRILGDLPPEKVEEMANPFFDFSKIEMDAIEKLAEFKDVEVSELLDECRRDRIYNQAQTFWKEPGQEPKAISATNQYLALMSTSLKGEFAKVLSEQEAGGANKTATLKSFCKTYSDTFLASNGLKPVEVTFDANGDLGTFSDEGTSHKININLSKINSVSELVSTLSHELTHAVEDAIKKSQGEVTKEGFGLVNNISNDISENGIDASTEIGRRQLDVLKKLNENCYRVNPHERTARYGEISAIKFMDELATTDRMRAQLEQTVWDFAVYQGKTLGALQTVHDDAKFEALMTEANEVYSSLPGKAKKLFDERMAYLKRARKETFSLESSMEFKSINDPKIKEMLERFEKEATKKQANANELEIEHQMQL